MGLSEEEKEVLRRAKEIQDRLNQEQLDAYERERVLRERELKRKLEQENAQREILREKKAAMAVEYKRQNETESLNKARAEKKTAAQEISDTQRFDTKIFNSTTVDAQKDLSVREDSVQEQEKLMENEDRLEEDIDKVPADFGEPVKKTKRYTNQVSTKSTKVSQNTVSEGQRTKKKKKKKRKKHPFITFFILLLAIIAVLLIGIYHILNSFAGMTDYQESAHAANRAADAYTESRVNNILLIGTDARNTDEVSRSDAIILVSINEKSHKIVLTSILRDSYVEIPGYGWNRINAAYQYGGADLLIATIENNFKIGIDSYVKVDFFSFIDLVDAVGGVDIDVDEGELTYINGYLHEINTLLGTPDANYIDPSTVQYGIMHLNGAQALAYSRIRYIGTDFQRTARQREVLNSVILNAKQASIPTLLDTVQIILPQLTTDIDDTSMTVLMMKALFYLNYDMIECRLPADGTWANLYVEGIAEVLQIDFESNIQILRETVYGN
ncbi:MAG: LCP family protein [Lachnospiraceae bacterium]